MALIGASGAGKSTVGWAIVGLLPAVARARGRVIVDGVDMLSASESQRVALRGWRVGHVPQSPAAALNPAQRVGAQVVEAVALRDKLSRAAARAFAVARLREVGLPSESATAWPHQLSGGQQRRAVIAMALATDPALLVADEPTASLDPLLRADVARLFRRLKDDRRLALVLITHDVRLAVELCDEAVVLLQGQTVERCGLHPLVPRHPYTVQLAATSGFDPKETASV